MSADDRVVTSDELNGRASQAPTLSVFGSSDTGCGIFTPAAFFSRVPA
jgi:hypothetical protein